MEIKTTIINAIKSIYYILLPINTVTNLRIYSKEPVVKNLLKYLMFPPSIKTEIRIKSFLKYNYSKLVVCWKSIRTILVINKPYSILLLVVQQIPF